MLYTFKVRRTHFHLKPIIFLFDYLVTQAFILLHEQFNQVTRLISNNHNHQQYCVSAISVSLVTFTLFPIFKQMLNIHLFQALICHCFDLPYPIFVKPVILFLQFALLYNYVLRIIFFILFIHSVLGSLLYTWFERRTQSRPNLLFQILGVIWRSSI